MRRGETNKGNKGRRRAKKTPEATQYAPLQDESNVESYVDNEFQIKEPKVHLKGVWDPAELGRRGLFKMEPYKIHHDIFAFICRWAYAFILTFTIALFIIILWEKKILGTNFDDSNWKIVLVILFIYSVATVSALLALKELPYLYTYFLKFTGIFSFLLVGTCTAVILTQNNLLGVNFDATFLKTVNGMCVIWLISIISVVAALFTIKDPKRLKTELYNLIYFVTLWGFIFCSLMILLLFAVVMNKHNFLGIDFDTNFFKIVGTLIFMVLLAGYCMFYSWFRQARLKKI